MLILLSSSTFTTYAVSPMTDVPFVCLCLAAMLAIAGERPGGLRATILGGVLSGAAYLIRYNGAFLLAPGLVGAIWRGGAVANRLASAALFLGAFLLAAAPWAWLNYTYQGAAFPSTNYVDVAKALGLRGDFRSLADVVLGDPARFLANYAQNAAGTFRNSLGASIALFPVGPLAILGLGLSLVRWRRRRVMIFLAGALSFLLFMSLTHWERRYHLFLLACYAGLAGFAITELGRGAARLTRTPVAARLAVAALALLIVVPSVSRSWLAVRTTLERQPVELLPAARYLERATSRNATVMAMRAHIAHLSGREWRELPEANSLAQLEAALRGRPPDYLVYDRWMRRLRTGLAPLGTPDGNTAWLEEVYRDPAAEVVIYAVRLPRS